MIVSHQAVTLQGHAPDGAYLSATVHLRLYDDGRLEVFDGNDWSSIAPPVTRVPITPAVPFDLDELRRQLGTEIVRKPVDLGDDPDGDLAGYDGAGA